MRFKSVGLAMFCWNWITQEVQKPSSKTYRS